MSNKKPSLMTLPKAASLNSFISTGTLEPALPPQAETLAVLERQPELTAPPAPRIEAPANMVRVQASNSATSGGKKKTSFNLDRDLHRQLKIMAVQKSRKLEDLLTEAIKSYLKKNDVAAA